MTVAIELDPKERERLQALAGTRGEEAGNLVHEAIQQYLDREEARADFEREALQSWRNYQETGLHLTGEELRTWLATWGTEEDSGPPACHK